MKVVTAVSISALEKIHDALELNVTFHKRRDEMNATVHQAAQVRYSPITTTTEAELERVKAILRGAEGYVLF